MSSVRFDFTGRTALITGAAGGIGGVLAELLHAAGAELVLADIDEAGVHRRAEALADTGPRVVATRLDASDPASVQQLADLVEREFGELDHLVPAAGIYPEAELATLPFDQWRRVLAINLDGVFLLTQRLLPLMRRGGSIVNLASIAGHRGSLGHGHYSVSKAGVISLTQNLALEVGPRGIRVNAVSPGIVVTNMTNDLRAAKGDQIVSQTPLGRNGEPEEIASAVAFLLSDAASFVHGETLHVNGGLFIAF